MTIRRSPLLGAIATALVCVSGGGLTAAGASAGPAPIRHLVGFAPDRLSVAAAADGSVYLANPVGNGQVQRFGADGAFLGAWGSYGRLPAGVASSARTLAADPAGNVYVAERRDSVLRLVSPEGRVLRQSRAGFEDIAVDAAGNLYGLGAEVTKLSPEGAELARWGLPEVSSGGALGIAADPAGGVYVADTFADRVLKLDAGGALVAVIGGRGRGEGRFVFPYDVATDSAGNLYVADTGNDRVQKLGPTGAYLGQWGGSGRGRGRFHTPTSIATGPAGDVYVADAAVPYIYAAGGARVQRFTAEGGFLAQWMGLPAAPRPRLFASVGRRTAKRSATFRFRVGRAADGFLCSLRGERVPRRLRRVRRCASPKRYAGLRPGRKVFSVSSLVGGERSAAAIRSWRIVVRRGAR